MNVPDLHRRAIESFTARMRDVSDDQWTGATPCTDWDLKTLVNHVVSEALWTPPLMDGSTIAEVGDHFEGDLLGEDPKRAWTEAAGPAADAMATPGAMERIVHLSFGDVPGKEYASQLFADYLIHSWDVARATGGDEKLDPELVDACAEWFASMEEAYRSVGAIGPRPEVPDGADPQSRLLAMFGRTT